MESTYFLAVEQFVEAWRTFTASLSWSCEAKSGEAEADEECGESHVQSRWSDGRVKGGWTVKWERTRIIAEIEVICKAGVGARRRRRRRRWRRERW
jgi:hypothetical protein